MTGGQSMSGIIMTSMTEEDMLEGFERAPQCEINCKLIVIIIVDDYLSAGTN